MRGPGHKLALDVRRLWRCPKCGYERKCNGRLTTVRCRCQDGPFMQLIAEPRFQRATNRPIDLYIDADELLGPPEESPAPEAEVRSTDGDTLPSDESGEPSTSVKQEAQAEEPTTIEVAPESASAADTSTVPTSTTADTARDNSKNEGAVESSEKSNAGKKRDRSGRRRRGRGSRGPKPPNK